MSRLRYSDFILVSDVDGTLIMPGGVIPRRNAEAINRFIGAGGRFSIASGRSVMTVRSLVERLPVNTPCALVNGSMLYDFTKGEYLWQIPLPDYSKAYIEDLKGLPPEIGMIVMTRDHYYNIADKTELSTGLMRKRDPRFVDPVDWRSIKEDWYKLLLLIPEGYFEDTMNFVSEGNFPGVTFTPSDRALIEMMPEGVNKGVAIRRLAGLLESDAGRIAAIGDFYNDLEMIKAAGIGAATREAPDDIKACARLVTCKCADGAVADLVEYLERTYP